MKFTCPKCSVQLQAEPELAGKTVKCPSCAAKVKIPENLGATKSHVPPPDADHSREDSPAEEEPAEEQEHYTGEEESRQIEYLYGGHIGNIASVNMLMALLIGGGIAALWLLAMWLIHTSVEGGTYLSNLFLERSFVQIVTTFLSGWTLGILILKFLHIKKQRRSLLLEVLPTDIDAEINIRNVADFYDHLIGLPQKLHSSYMFQRIRRGLEYFYVRESNTEVSTMMSMQSDIDANSIANSYALPKVFLWAIPILGFIGTVLGIGNAIGGFAGTLEGMGQDPQEMVSALKNVLGSLGTAFDTTFLALIFSILLMIPASSLQAAEEDVLNQVDEYCNDNLLKRLNDGGAGAGAPTDAAALRSLGDAISASNKDVVGKFADIHSNMKQVYEEQTKHYQSVASAVDKQLEAIDERAKKYEKRLDEDFFKSLEKIRTESVSTINAGIGPLTEGIKNLNQILKELDGKQVVIKKKWWPF